MLHPNRATLKQEEGNLCSNFDWHLLDAQHAAQILVKIERKQYVSVSTANYTQANSKERTSEAHDCSVTSLFLPLSWLLTTQSYPSLLAISTFLTCSAPSPAQSGAIFILTMLHSLRLPRRTLRKGVKQQYARRLLCTWIAQ